MQAAATGAVKAGKAGRGKRRVGCGADLHRPHRRHCAADLDRRKEEWRR